MHFIIASDGCGWVRRLSIADCGVPTTDPPSSDFGATSGTDKQGFYRRETEEQRLLLTQKYSICSERFGPAFVGLRRGKKARGVWLNRRQRGNEDFVLRKVFTLDYSGLLGITLDYSGSRAAI